MHSVPTPRETFCPALTIDQVKVNLSFRPIDASCERERAYAEPSYLQLKHLAERIGLMSWQRLSVSETEGRTARLIFMGRLERERERILGRSKEIEHVSTFKILGYAWNTN